jgi:transcriptional regulator with XRE-family HTH domain
MRTDRQAIARAFGAALREIRSEQQLSQEQLALAASVDRTFVSKAERGLNQPALTTVFLLSAALKVPAAELIARTDTHLGRRRGLLRRT